MTPEQYRQFLAMQQSLGALLKWKQDREQQLIPNPLDNNSQAIIYQDIPIFKRFGVNQATNQKYMTFEINGKEYKLFYG